MRSGDRYGRLGATGEDSRPQPTNRPIRRSHFSDPIGAATTELAAGRAFDRAELLSAAADLSAGGIEPAEIVAVLEPIADLSAATGEPPSTYSDCVLRVNAIWGASAAETASRTRWAIADGGLTFADCRAMLRYTPADGADPRRRVREVLEDAHKGKRRWDSGERLARYVHGK